VLKYEGGKVRRLFLSLFNNFSFKFFIFEKNKMQLEMKNITKRFPGVIALDNVNLSVEKGEVHSLCGENGAGKSTLMKILNGVYKADEGEIFFNGEKVDVKSPHKAQKLGLSIIFQELNLVNSLSIAENIFLGRLKKNKFGKILWKDIFEDAAELLGHIGCELDPKTEVGKLSVSQKQMVEIAKALSFDSKIIIMDEPSATLTEKEVEKLYSIIRELKSNEITVIYISHKMDEIFDLSDRVTVMRDGMTIDTMQISKTSREDIVNKMVGRDMDHAFPRRIPIEGAPVLKVENLSIEGKLFNINFELKKSEVLSFAGLVGAGRTELLRAIFGADKIDAGEIFLYGKKVKINSPVDAIENGIALLNEDRKEEGLVLTFSVAENISAAKLGAVTKLGFIQKTKEKKVANKYVDDLSIKTPDIYQRCINLSGGNQQKVALAKWLYSDAEILMLDEPTRGIDVGAKQEIYLIINELVKRGKSVIFVSSEMPEVLALSDRIIVMHEGKIKGEFDNKQKKVTSEQILHCAIG